MPVSEFKKETLLEIPLSQSLKVLVAEDNNINQRVIAALLKSLGHSSVLAADGAQALQSMEAQAFDVVIMDVMMPVMDGLEAVAAIRKRESVTGQRVPIVMATAHSEPGDRDRFLNAGADGYVVKPIDVGQLQSELARVLA